MARFAPIYPLTVLKRKVDLILKNQSLKKSKFNNSNSNKKVGIFVSHFDPINLTLPFDKIKNNAFDLISFKDSNNQIGIDFIIVDISTYNHPDELIEYQFQKHLPILAICKSPLKKEKYNAFIDFVVIEYQLDDRQILLEEINNWINELI